MTHRRTARETSGLLGMSRAEPLNALPDLANDQDAEIRAVAGGAVDPRPDAGSGTRLPELRNDARVEEVRQNSISRGVS